MASFNKVILLGNVTRDPEVRYTPKGMAITKLGLAVNRKWRTETGEQKEEVTFVDVTAFGKQAETLGQYVRKGSPLFIEGRLNLEQWDDKQTGQKRSKLAVIVEGFQLLGAKTESGAPAPKPETSGTDRTNGTDADKPPEDKEIPF